VIRAEGRAAAAADRTPVLAILGALEAATAPGSRTRRHQQHSAHHDGRVSSPTSASPGPPADSPITGAGMRSARPSYIPPSDPGAAAGPPPTCGGWAATLYAAVEAARRSTAGDPDGPTLHAWSPSPPRPPIGPGRRRGHRMGLLRKDPRRRRTSRPVAPADALRAFDRERAGAGGAPSQGSGAGPAPELPWTTRQRRTQPTAPPRSTATAAPGERHPERHRGRPARRDPLPTPDPALTTPGRSLLRMTPARPNRSAGFRPGEFSIRPSSRNTPRPNGHPNSVPYSEEERLLRFRNGILRNPLTCPDRVQAARQPATATGGARTPARTPTPDNAAPADAGAG